MDDLDKMMEHLGDFGRYQMWQFTLHILAAFTAGLHMLTIVMVAAVPDHRCKIPGVDVNGTAAPWNSTEVLDVIPVLPSGNLDSCRMIVDNVTLTCNNWVYDATYYTTTRATEWNFVCNRRWMGSVAQSIYMFGVFTGAVVLGRLADKYGRKKIFCWSALLQLILGLIDAFIPDYYLFLLVRFFYGMFGSAGAYITGFVLTMEIVGPSKRSVCGIAFQAAFSIGIMCVAAWAALIKGQFLQVVYGLHGLLLIGHWWLMDESPRWLWSQGRIKESVEIVRKGVKMNRGEEFDVAYYLARGKAVERQTEEDEAGILDLFRTPNMRKKALNVCLCWFANSLVYYGLSLNTGKMAGNPFLMLFVIGLVELPSYAVTVILMDRTGRRALTSSYMIVGSVCCVIGAYLALGSVESITVIMLGKFFISSSFAIIYNYSAELFPTVIRNTALGVGSMCARASGTLTPLITLLDSFDPRLPSVVFAVISLTSGLLTMFLPETLGAPMPQSLKDGEEFGVGDTCFTSCVNTKRKNRRNVSEPYKSEQMEPLDDLVR